MTAPDVARWHCHPDPILRNSGDTVSAHQFRVQTLCIELAARLGHSLHGSDLTRAARFHDAAETVLGDMPAPAKERFPALAAAYEKAELAVLVEMGLTWNLTRKESDMLALCDKLDAYTWARKHGATGEEWDHAMWRLKHRAHRLGPDAVDWLEGAL